MRPRRLPAVVRGPRLVAAGLVLVCAYLFATNLTPRPRYVVRTEAKYDQDREGRISLRGPAFWGSVPAVSDDGSQVTVGIHRSVGRFWADTRLEVWDSRTGMNETPAHWADPSWQRLLQDRAFWASADTGLMYLLSDPSGRVLLHDESAWAALRDRLAVEQGRPVDDARQPVRPVGDEEQAGGRFPASLRFSADGRLVAYVARNGRPVQPGSESTADGTVVERVRGGGRVALLPGVTNEVRLAPGGRTAVSEKLAEQREGVRLRRAVIFVFDGESALGPAPERPQLVLWDLETATPRAELSLPGPGSDFEYSPDGRYVFARCVSPQLFRWWDTATGTPVGEIAGSPSYLLADRGRVLVIQSTTEALRFWDVASGRELDEWEPATPPGWTGRIGRVLSPGYDRYLVAEFHLNPDPAATKSFPFLDRVVERVADKVRPPGRASMVVVLDVAESRVLGPVPGRDAAVSPNGRWLATLDPDGVVRVWSLPLGRPWLRGLVYATAVVLGGWAVVKLLAKLRRRIWRPSAD